MLGDVLVQGIPTVQRAVVNQDESDNSKYHLLEVEGIVFFNGTKIYKSLISTRATMLPNTS